MKLNIQNTISAVRSFNRYYTNILGLLDQHILDSGYSLPEVRIMHEINKSDSCTSKMLADSLNMDQGYLSRLVKKLTAAGMLLKTPSPDDKRSSILSLTGQGKTEVHKLNQLSDLQISEMIQSLSAEDRAKLVGCMDQIKDLLP